MLWRSDYKMDWKVIWSSLLLCCCPRTVSPQWASHKARAKSVLAAAGIKKKKDLRSIQCLKKKSKNLPRFEHWKESWRLSQIGRYRVFIKMYTALTECLNIHKYLPGIIWHFILFYYHGRTQVLWYSEWPALKDSGWRTRPLIVCPWWRQRINQR